MIKPCQHIYCKLELIEPRGKSTLGLEQKLMNPDPGSTFKCQQPKAGKVEIIDPLCFTRINLVPFVTSKSCIIHPFLQIIMDNIYDISGDI